MFVINGIANAVIVMIMREHFSRPNFCETTRRGSRKINHDE